jgi:hypothetical protein
MLLCHQIAQLFYPSPALAQISKSGPASLSHEGRGEFGALQTRRTVPLKSVWSRPQSSAPAYPLPLWERDARPRPVNLHSRA